MPIIRLIILAVAIGLIIHFVKRYLSSRRRRNESPTTLTSDLVKCNYCGLHIPKTGVIRDGNQYFCSDQHRKLAGK